MREDNTKLSNQNGGMVLLKTECITLLLGLLCSLFITGLLSSHTFALTYQSGVGVQFTFNETLSMNVSGDLSIDNLAPGSYSDSNVITVSVNTNAAYGYLLSATVGTKSGGSSALSNGSSTFTNLTGNVATLSAFSDNYWGYSYSTDNGTTWVSGNAGSTSAGYNGLPLDNNDSASDLGYGGVTLIDTENAADSDSIQFKIGAKASTDQASGTYTNTVNFYAITYAAPMTLANAYAAAGASQTNGYYKLQDMTSSICSSVEVEDDELQVIDTRDGKVYWIAKLRDGNCWMTQNLDLDLEHTPTEVAALTSNNTDLNQFGSNGYDTSHGYSCSNPSTTTNCTASGEVITWTPTNTTRNYAEATGTAWVNDYDIAYSMDTGDYYYAGSDGTSVLTSTTVNYLTTTNTDYFDTSAYAVNGEHGHVGNHYNWSAAVASDYTNGFTTSTYGDPSGNPKNSICPKGWRLPTATSASPSYSSAGSKNEFARLAYLYAGYTGSTSISSLGMESAPLYFARSGYVDSGSLGYSGSYGSYWSSTVLSSNNSYYLYFYATRVYPSTNDNRSYGRAVRCVAN